MRMNSQGNRCWDILRTELFGFFLWVLRQCVGEQGSQYMRLWAFWIYTLIFYVCLAFFILTVLMHQAHSLRIGPWHRPPDHMKIATYNLFWKTCFFSFYSRLLFHCVHVVLFCISDSSFINFIPDIWVVFVSVE